MRRGNEKVFVYGTLKPRFHFGNLYLTQWHNHPAQIYGDLYMVNQGTYAGLKPNTTNIVEGFIYEVDERMLKVLDRVEGCPTFYNRIKVQTLGMEEVWVYEYVAEEFIEQNRIVHGVFEYTVGLYDKIVLLEPQRNHYVQVMLGGRVLRIENPLIYGYKNNPLNVEHPATTIMAKYQGKEFLCKFLSRSEIYDFETEGVDLLTQDGEVITGIPLSEIELYEVE